MHHIDYDVSLDDLEAELIFIQEAVAADPDAADLLPLTDTWITRLDAHRGRERGARRVKARAAALKQVGLARMDESAKQFALELSAAVGGDHGVARWTLFFRERVSSFVRGAADEQVKTVRRWIGLKDDALDRHRAALTAWADKTADALKLTLDAANERGTSLVGKETLVDEVNRELDGLLGALLARQAEKKFPHGWADAFFPVTRRRARRAEADTVPTPPTPAPVAPVA